VQDLGAIEKDIREAVALGRARAKASAQSRTTNSRTQLQDKA
jgi:hypothetical protein